MFHNLLWVTVQQSVWRSTRHQPTEAVHQPCRSELQRRHFREPLAVRPTADSSKVQILKVPPLILGSYFFFFFFSLSDWICFFQRCLGDRRANSVQPRRQIGTICCFHHTRRESVMKSQERKKKPKRALCPTRHRGRVCPLRTSCTGNKILDTEILIDTEDIKDEDTYLERRTVENADRP